MEQHFFQTFFSPQQQQPVQQLPPNMIYNENVLEISNNWLFVKDLIKRYKGGELTKVDKLENVWLNFIVANNIDILNYTDEDQFLNLTWKGI